MISYVLKAMLINRHNWSNRVLQINDAYRVTVMTEPSFGAHYVVVNDADTRYFDLMSAAVDAAQRRRTHNKRTHYDIHRAGHVFIHPWLPEN